MDMARYEDNSMLDVVKLASGIGIEEFESRELTEQALHGDPASEFIVGSWYEAAGELTKAREWYNRAAKNHYAPALRKLSMAQFRKAG